MRILLRHMVTSGAMALVLAVGAASTATAVSSVIEVPAPVVSDYWVSVSRQPGGVLVFDGYAPDAKTRDHFAEEPGADVNWLKLGSGAPSVYPAAVELGLDILERLTEGRFALRGSVLSFSGVAASQADFLALRQILAKNLPDGLILAMAEIDAPRVADYTFSARRQPNGNLILSGFVPDPDLEARLLTLAGPQSSSTLRFGSGEPLNFESALSTAMPLLALLEEGEVKLDGGAWTLSGTPKSAANAKSIQAAFSSNHLAETGWNMALVDPAPAAVAKPYVWQAEKSPSGGVVMTGSVPTQALQRVLALRIGDNLIDNTKVTDSAPDDFVTHALAAADALSALESGKVGFDGTTWFVEGIGETAAAKETISANLAAPADAWTVKIEAPVSVVAEVPPAGETVAIAEATPMTAQAPQAAPIPPTATSQAAIDQCQAVLAQISAQNGILFRSGAAILAEGVEPVLQSIATAVAQCPSVAIDIAGHTDADGEALANLALSVARAEAVVSALVALGVAPERLYAIGFGESQPIADNDTAAGKAQNRRIVVSVHRGD